jgi:hypothetical protein
MILRITHDDDTASAGFDFVALGDTFSGVVGALGVEVRADFADERANIFFREDDDRVDVGKSGQNFCSFFCRDDGPAFALQRAGRLIGVHRNHDFAAKPAGSLQITHVANVQEVETPVGERDATASAAPLGYAFAEFVTREDLRLDRCAQ